MARQRVLNLPGVNEADVRIVWDPPWDPSMMTDAAKKKLGMS
jgi:metal-sulfur cluster biosynthetic enzyme